MKKKLVLVSGHFNVIHPGHLRLFRFAKDCAERLVVAVQSDDIAKSAAYVPEKLRLEGVKSNSWVDEAFIMSDSIEEEIKRIKPDIVVKGKEHELKENPELAELKKYGGELLFSSGETIFSSVDLIHREFHDNVSHAIKLPKEFLIRHGISHQKILTLIEKFKKLKICVIGDLIVDEYITCEPLGLSQEDPTVVVTPIDKVRFIGGAGIVAAHAASLGASVEFISVAGNDETHTFAKQNLFSHSVKTNIFIDENRPTTLKQRFRSKGKSLLRVSHLHQGAIPSSIRDDMFRKVEDVVKSSDLLVFSDFNYGCLPQILVEKIISVAKENNLIMAADSQSSSQVGDISRFKDMDLITPTEREARISTRNHEDGLVVLAEKLRQSSLSKNILLKLGEEGLLVHGGSKDPSDWQTDRVDALNLAPKDVSGAGDSLLIAGAMALACGGNIWDVACIGSIAAAVQVGRVGNIPLRASELLLD